MSNKKATKVPVMQPNQPYIDWKKELQIWKATNTALTVGNKIQAGVLFESLSGVPRRTVLSELTVEEIISDDGVEKIISTLDNYFMGNTTQQAFSSIDDLMNYKCKPGTTIENFIVEFQMRVNKVKASGTILPDGVLGYTLLIASNLKDDKLDMIKATCEELTYKNVKAQLEKIGFGRGNEKSGKVSGTQEAGSSNVKVEPCFYGYTRARNLCYGSSESSSEEDLNGEKVFYAGKQFSAGHDSKKFQMNPTDRFGHIRSCTFCKCTYHWLVDCPYAPSSIKNQVNNKKGKYNNNNNNIKPL
jgi:hypothetical protein